MQFCKNSYKVGEMSSSVALTMLSINNFNENLEKQKKWPYEIKTDFDSKSKI